MDEDGQSWENRPDNPTVKITLHFQDGLELHFLLKKPAPQIQIMELIGRLLRETGNPVEIDL